MNPSGLVFPQEVVVLIFPHGLGFSLDIPVQAIEVHYFSGSLNRHVTFLLKPLKHCKAISFFFL